MTIEKDFERGQRAERLLNDDLVKEARAHIESEIIRLFKAATPTDIEALSQIKAMEYFSGKFFAFLERTVKDGRIAQFELERRKKTIKERVSGLMG